VRARRGKKRARREENGKMDKTVFCGGQTSLMTGKMECGWGWAAKGSAKEGKKGGRKGLGIMGCPMWPY